METKKMKFQFAIDRGGTFTDVFATSTSETMDGGTKKETTRCRVLKLLSEDPANYSDAPREAIRRVLQEELGQAIPPAGPVPVASVDWIRMGTTVATNALLERKGERMALVITKGFKDLLFIGNQARPKIFDLEILTPEVLYDEVIEVDERVVLQQEKCELAATEWFPKTGESVRKGVTGETVAVWRPVNHTALRKDLKVLLSKGIESIAVVLLHSYIFPDHEKEVGAVAEEMGFKQVSLSHEVMPMVRAVPRGLTTCADAYLTPCIRKYVSGFASGFENNLEGVRLLFMKSDGGLTPMDKFRGSRAILSGPAGGVVGYALTTYGKEAAVSSEGRPLAVIGFDMGGTSTDVSRYNGAFEHTFETVTAGVAIQAPQLDVNTVAAGGGSMLFFRSGMFVVGPESAGAHPGPTCYRKGGPLTVTDANLVLGRLLPDYFPSIFGPTEDQPLDKDAPWTAFKELTRKVNESVASPLSVADVAQGFLRVANEAMCRPIRALTQAKGYDTSRHVLACFGGAGGQHACDIARDLGMKTVFIHRYAGILSAYGMALADVVHEAQEPCAFRYEQNNFGLLDERIDALAKECWDELRGQGFSSAQIRSEAFLHLRYDGTDCALMCSPADVNLNASPSSPSPHHGDFLSAFLLRYDREFGFTIAGRAIVVDDIRVRGVAESSVVHEAEVGPEVAAPSPVTRRTVVFDGSRLGKTKSVELSTGVYLLNDLRLGNAIAGPAVIVMDTSTVLVTPGCTARITRLGDIRIDVGDETPSVVSPLLDAIQLSIFSHRFMSIAEQMGRVLQRTAISTNIKERLDFSCALFGPDGGLVANAPHIPVHLGAMQETVQYQIRTLKDDLREGDVILSNHPCAGGSHLPDLTVITPVFYQHLAANERPVFFVAARGHHADIGGITPGSMPPHSKSIFEEGAVFKSFKLVRGGVFQEEGVTAALNAPAQFPGATGTRNLADNLSDLRAQVAANRKGITLVCELIDAYGLDVVQAYMKFIQENAELAVREMLTEIAAKTKAKTGNTFLYASDFMDEGAEICLRVEIDATNGSAVFDFTGTALEQHSNINAPRAVTLSAIIYCLRSMVGYDVPLNQGCLTPIKVVLPPGCFLAPSSSAAVVGGNVLTSQRVVDVIFKAFAVCAASQGCMNNITFGDKEVGYYETVAGGAGAGPGWHGRSGIHTHMTNTRITDPEILERRYPVLLRRFQLRMASGGRGQFCGGDGIVREICFRRPLTLSILTERRVFAPYGLNGGAEGGKGRNTLIYGSSGRKVGLGAKTSASVVAGDTFVLETPGGGGYGDEALREGESEAQKKKFVNTGAEKGSLFQYKMLQESA